MAVPCAKNLSAASVDLNTSAQRFWLRVKELVQLLAKVVGWNGKSPLHFQNFNLIYLHNHSVNFAQISRDHKRPRIF